MKINLKESLNKIDLATNNKYDLLNTFNSKKLSDNSKKKLAEAIENNSMASINRVLHESSEQLYKVVISSGATKINFESALYEDEAEGIVDYYGGRWIDENGFEWDMYVEEDDDSTEHAMVDNSYDMEDDDERSQRECIESLTEDLSSVKEIKQLDFTNNRVNNLRGIFSTKSFVKALNAVGLDKFKIRTSRLKNVSSGDLKDAWYDLKRNGWMMSIERDPSLSGFNEVYVFEKITNESLDEQLTEASYGGAYDIEDDMFFTKEEIVELADEVCDLLKNKFGYDYETVEVGMESTTELYLCIQDIHGVEEESMFRIDMRKIRKPSDLFKYAKPIAGRLAEKFEDEYQYYNFDESLKEDLSDLDLFLNTPADTKQFNDETFRALKNLVSEYKKDLDSLDKWAPEYEKEPFVKKWYKLADKCKEIAKNGIKGITGYGRTGDFIKLKVVDLARSVDNTFPWYTRNNLAKFNKLESLTEDTVKQSGMWVNKGDTGKTHGKFKTKKAADQQRKAMFSNNYKAECLEESNDEDSEDKVAVFTKGIDGKTYYHGFMDRKEADKHYPDRLKESFDDETDFETDFDDGEVEEGSVFFADGTDWVWEERIAGPLYLDFDKWAVWSAREYVDPRDFMVIEPDGKEYKFDGDAFKEKAMATPITYFVVEEDTGFIDWGPEDNEIAAKDFLNGKKEDWENDIDESLNEDKELNEYYIVNLHYEDIGDGREYDYEADYDDILEYLMEICVDDDNAPEDTQEYIDWVEANFDYLLKKYEYRVLNYFEEDASQEEYDRRHSSYEPEYDPMD